MNKKDLIQAVLETVPTSQEMALLLSNLEDALKTIEDERIVCLLKKRYFEELTIKNSGRKVMNLGTAAYKKLPCDGVSPERARQMILNGIRLLRHPKCLHILWGRD